MGHVKRPRSAAFRRAVALWDDSPRSARLHTTIRAWTAPFEALELHVPRSGAVLEIGCGHGLFATFLALSSPERRVVGIDIDAEKIELAKKMSSRLADGDAELSFDRVTSGEVPTVEGGWDAIVFADVLYLLQPEARSRLLVECAEALAPSGVLIVKEVDTEPRMKARVAQFQEFLATRVLRITQGDAMDFPSADELSTEMARAGLVTRTARLDKGYFHPHCVVIGSRPTVDGQQE